MRVLHVYGGALLGGIETMLVTIAREQQVCPSLIHEFALSGDGPVQAALAGVPATRARRLCDPAAQLHALHRALAGMSGQQDAA